MPDQRLLGRDPRNRLHVARAIELITAKAEGRHVTEASALEMRAAGLKLPANFKIDRRPPKRSVLLAWFFLLEEGPMFPDNILTTCADCGAALQIRPHAQNSTVRLCCFCTLDRMELEEAQKSKRKKKK